MKRPAARKPPTVDWVATRERIEAAGRSIAGEAEITPERARLILEERARSLARPALPPLTNSLELVTFGLASERCGVESRYVVGVFPLLQLAALPGAQAPVFGVTVWRGELLTVLDIRPLLGATVGALNDLSRIIALGQTQAAFGVVVDAVEGLVRLPQAEVVPAPTSGTAAREYVRGVTNQALLVLDGERLLQLHA